MAAAPAVSGDWPANKVRDTFVGFFQEKAGHVHYKSSPCVPHEDPTLLFANAGMNQFKPLFLGVADPAGPLANLKRAVNSQKCIRAGGKHNDLDDVGKDTYHHTFFEMLGNWSFGDYFKEEAITWAWQLLTETYGLPKDRLYASYFAGDAASGLAPDEEARSIWLRFLPAERILPFDKKANFWEMGETGPCGPCSEIHFDRLGGRDAAKLVNADDPTVIEIWNIVFMQFNREPDGSLRELPAKHIDTGMGFERLTSILQNKLSNYDTDIFLPLFEAIQKITAQPAYAGKLGKDDVDGRDMAYRVIADHARTLTFAITDGAVPSNEGRGYVLRRILRRAVRYGQQFLKAKPGFFSELVPVVVSAFKGAFPELEGKQAFVIEVVKDEEDSFTRTLANGIKHFNKMAEKVKASGGATLSGSDAFFLYDSMGFPLDLTQIMAGEQGLAVDGEGFLACMAEQKARSQAASKFTRTFEKLVLEAEETAWLAKKGIKPTNDEAKYKPLGADNEPLATVQAIFTKDGFLADDAAATPDSHTSIGVLLDATSFYAESGGQVADQGLLTLHGGAEGSPAVVVEVDDVQVFGGFVLHTGSVRKAGAEVGGDNSALKIKVGDKVQCSVDPERRSRIAPNHTMTHVLNFALREVLGAGVDQKGSTVQPDKLRFDYSTNKALTPQQIETVERIVNEKIDSALPVFSEVIPLAQARSLHTLRAVFGETYPDPVRVVSVGESIPSLLKDPENAAWMGLSVELCGGTHLKNTSQAAKFAILEEGSIAKGVRRIVAATREAAVQAHSRGAELSVEFSNARALSGAALETKAEQLKKQLDEAVVPAAVKARLRDELSELFKRVLAEQKAIAAKQAEAAKAVLTEAVTNAKAANSAAAVVIDVSSLKGDLSAVKSITTSVKEGAVLLVSSDGATKVSVSAICAADAVAKGLKAGEWLNIALAAAGGKGGGSDAFASGSGKEHAKVAEVMAAGQAHATSKGY